LHEGFRIGLMTGLGAALADGAYGFVAAFGLTAISSLLIAHQFWIRLIGGHFLLYLGAKIFLAAPAHDWNLIGINCVVALFVGYDC
jgi:threonine/homoserine/homoserine lactone efflux protein